MIDLFHPTLPERLHVRVTPKASSNRIKIEYGEKGELQIKAYVTTAPEKGKANQAVIDLLSETFRIPKSHFHLIQGETSRNKIFLIRQ